MQKRNVMEKNIVEEINDKEMEKGLVLNTSYDIFYLGKSISKYDNLVHYKSQYDDPSRFDDYEIEIHGYNIELWCENDHIVNICCRESCIYNGKELIKMNFENFLSVIKEEPSNHEICYIPCKDNWGQNQHVYVFDKSGLQVWVWRGRIRTIIIYDTNSDAEGIKG